MAIIYASSMDQYGAAAGSTEWDNSSPGYWLLDNDIMLGDGWASLPEMFCLVQFDKIRPIGTYSIGVPSFGARQGDYALIADGASVYATSGSQQTAFTWPSAAAMRFNIPGISQATRIIHVAFAIDELPTEDVMHGAIMDFRNSSGDVRATLKVTPTGRLALYSHGTVTFGTEGMTQSPTNLLTSQAPVIEAGTWYSLNIVITNDTADTCDFDLYVGDISVANRALTGTGLAFSDTGNIDQIGFLPATMSGDFTGNAIDTNERAIRDIVICDTSGSYNTSALGQVFVSAQEMRVEDDEGDNWGVNPRENFSTGILNATVGTAIRFADNAAFDIGTGDFTLETEVRFNSIPDASLAEEMDLIARWAADDDERSYRLYYDGATASLKFDVSTDGAAVTTIKEIPWTIEKWKWHHIAVSRWTDTSGSYTSLFINGEEVGVPVADTNDYYAVSAPIGVAGQFAADNTLNADTVFDGWLDETRITVGTGRYTADFSRPTAVFGRDVGGDSDFANVVVLLGYDGAVVDEGPATRTVNVDATTPVTAIAPDDDDYSYQVLNQRPAWDDTFVEATNYFAESVLTLFANPLNTETVTVGAITYTFVNTLSGSANEVLIGASIADTLSNLTAAVNGGTGEGAVYGTGTTANTAAYAITYASPELVFRAVVVGVSSVATTETLSQGEFNHATLHGGTDIPSDSDFAVERLPVDVTGVLGVQVTARANKTDAGTTSMRFDLVGPSAGVAAGTAFAPDLSPQWQRQVFEEDPDTAASITPSTVIGGRIRFKRVS